MGMTVQLKQTDVTVALDAAIRRGLLAGGQVVLAASDALAPTEPEPKHGVHMTETGFVRVEPGDGVDQAAIGYRAFWAPWQEEDLEYAHPHGGQAKFLEVGALSSADRAFGAIAEKIREAFV